MQNSSNESVIIEKTLALCEAIVCDPEFQATRRHVETFKDDKNARGLYEKLNKLGESLHQKQHQGITLEASEIEAFNKGREDFLANPVAKNFIEAQEKMHHIQETISRFVIKTFELGRLPEPADFKSDCCGGHHHGEGSCECDEGEDQDCDGCSCKH